MTQTPDNQFQPIDVGTHLPSPDIGFALLQLAKAQDRQNELLEELIEEVSAKDRAKACGLRAWKNQNSELAHKCLAASNILGKVQNAFLDRVATEICDDEENLTDGEFSLYEFLDRYGQRLANLNGALQVFSQLGSHG